VNEYFLLYLFTRLGVLTQLLAFSFAIGAVGSVACYWLLHAEQINCSGPRRIAIWMFFVGLAGSIIVPSKQDVAIILGGKMAIDIANSQEVSDVSKKILQAINKKLDEAAK